MPKFTNQIQALYKVDSCSIWWTRSPISFCAQSFSQIFLQRGPPSSIYARTESTSKPRILWFFSSLFAILLLFSRFKSSPGRRWWTPLTCPLVALALPWVYPILLLAIMHSNMIEELLLSQSREARVSVLGLNSLLVPTQSLQHRAQALFSKLRPLLPQFPHHQSRLRIIFSLQHHLQYLKRIITLHFQNDQIFTHVQPAHLLWSPIWCIATANLKEGVKWWVESVKVKTLILQLLSL